MKVRLTESQYDKLLKVVNSNKKLIITESQYKRLILEFTDQFSGIEADNCIKIISNNKPYTFKVFAELNNELLVRNLNDGRYKSQYFLIKPGSLKNNSLITQKSKAIIYDYDDLDKFNQKEKDAQLKDFTFKNVTSFEVYKDEKFDMLVDPKLDVMTGMRLALKTKHENDGDEFKDNLIRGLEANHAYLLTFYDESTVKFTVTKKNNTVIDIVFETVNEKTSMGSDELDKRNKDNKEVWKDWFNKQKILITSLRLSISKITDANEKDKEQKKLDKAIKDFTKHSFNRDREEGLSTISKNVYKGAVATKWMEALINSPEFKNKNSLKIDLNKTIVNKQKIKTLNKDNDAEVTKLKQELATASSEEEKKRIQKELDFIDKIQVLHFLNPKFDTYNNVAEGTRTFDLILDVTYVPDEKSKTTNNGMEWSNINEKEKIKEFSLRGIKNLTIIKDKVEPSLTDKRDDRTQDDINYQDSLNMQNIEKLIKNDKGAQDMLLKKPGILASLFKDKTPKGIIPNEELQRSLGLEFNDKKFNNKFTAGNRVQFETNLADVKISEENVVSTRDNEDDKQVNNNFTPKELFDVFKKALKLSQESKYRYSGIGLVKVYSTGDRNVVVNMYVKHEANGKNYKILYSLFFSKGNSIIMSDDINGKQDNNTKATDGTEKTKGKVYDSFKVTLKASLTANTAKKEVATLTVYIGVGDGFNGYKVN
jgi:hypothetical protein